VRCYVCYWYVLRSIYLELVLRYTYLIWILLADTVYWRQQGCEDSWLFFEVERGPRAKK